MAKTDRRLLLLDERDNVFVAGAAIAEGETIAVDGSAITLVRTLPLGHKLSRCAIALGTKILKYGVPIGSATQPIAQGTHVHVHNIKSDYTPTHHLLREQQAHQEATQ